jgi:hypothetical protein
MQVYKQHSPIVELTTEDISAFIIPPPPSTAAATAGGAYRKRSLTRPAPTTDGPPSFTEREIQEVRVATEQLELHKELTAPKVTTLQERISQLKLTDSTITSSKTPPIKEAMGLNLQKDRFGYPLAAESSKSPLRVDAAGPVARRASSSAVTAAEQPPPPPLPRSQMQQRREVFMRQVSSPDMTVKPFVLVPESDSPGESTAAGPPPPPPRATLPGGFGTLGRKQPPLRYQV